MNYTKFKPILDFIPNDVRINNILNEELSKHIINFINFIKDNNILVSLSGGVDSMVLSYIIKQIPDINLICCHINYNNREETILEKDFLIEWCKFKNITLDVYEINHIKREDNNRSYYEEETKNLRYNYYKESCIKYNCSGVFLAHHMDDLSENIFNNIMRGRKDITDLTVLKEKNKIFDVNVYRPMLNFKKDIIYDISEKYQIPYFLDTTPNWSCRGKMRREIFPKCNECYGDTFINSIIKLGNESDEISSILNNYLIPPIFNNIKYGKYGFIIPITEILSENIILKIILKKIYCKLNIEIVIKQKYINILINFIKNRLSNCIKIIPYYINFIIDNQLYFINENIKQCKNYTNIIIVSNKNYDYNDLINGYINFIWKKNRYVPNYDIELLKTNIGNLENLDNVSKCITVY